MTMQNVHDHFESESDRDAGRPRNRWASIGAAVLGAAMFGGLGFAGAGCETTEGVGEDVSEVGEAIDESAEDAQRDW
jgi:predicted small secreted protein